MGHNLSYEIHLKQWPVGKPTTVDFELVRVPVPEPQAGEVLVRNIYLSLEPYMRLQMVNHRGYFPIFQLGEPMTGGCVGQVVKSNNRAYAEGDYVQSMFGWREYYLSDGQGVNIVDPTVAPLQTFLGTMGIPGMAAYFGLLEIGNPQPCKTVFVSAAASTVGAVVCQIAKLKGCYVVGSAGSAAKLAWLKEIGVDATINYKEVDNLTNELVRLCPQGLDIYFDNVGGDHLQAALAVANTNARVAVCGMISQYNAIESVSVPNNLMDIIFKRLGMSVK